MFDDPVLFDVEGPFDIPYDAHRKGVSKRISVSHGREFWSRPDCAPFRGATGCYVFALASGPGHSPWYVGKATKGFEQEVFTDHKIRTYNDVVFAGHKGKPVMFFVVRPGKKSAIGAKQIDEVETFLIQAAIHKNPELRNIKKIGGPPWGIRGVVRGGRGQTTAPAKKLKGMMRL